MKDTITREFNEPAVKGHRHGSTFPRNGFTERLELAEVSWRVDRTSLGAVCAGPVCTGCTTSKSIKGELPPAHYPQIFRTGCPSPAQKPGLLKRQCSVVIVAATCPHSTLHIPPHDDADVNAHCNASAFPSRQRLGGGQVHLSFACDCTLPPSSSSHFS